MKYVILRSFLKKFDSYGRAEQGFIVECVERVKEYLETNQAPYGLRIKKLSPKIFEGRINIHLRIMYFRDNGTVKFFCLGNHDDVHRCLKSFKKSPANK
jgi:hypothetical protein